LINAIVKHSFVLQFEFVLIAEMDRNCIVYNLYFYRFVMESISCGFSYSLFFSWYCFLRILLPSLLRNYLQVCSQQSANGQEETPQTLTECFL